MGRGNFQAFNYSHLLEQYIGVPLCIALSELYRLTCPHGSVRVYAHYGESPLHAMCAFLTELAIHISWMSEHARGLSHSQAKRMHVHSLFNLFSLFLEIFEHVNIFILCFWINIWITVLTKNIFKKCGILKYSYFSKKIIF